MSIVQIGPHNQTQTPIVATVAANVRAEMGRGQVTQTAMARILGITKSAMSNRYRGATPYTLNDLAVIADALGTTVPKLCAARDSNPEPAGKGPLRRHLALVA